MTAARQSAAAQPAHTIHHRETVTGTAVTIDVCTTGATAATGLSRQLTSAWADNSADAAVSTARRQSRWSRGEHEC